MCSLKPRCAETQRTTFLKIACFENHLQGIAGPGAPHVYRLDRFENAGPTGKPEETTSAKKVTKKFFSIPWLLYGFSAFPFPFDAGPRCGPE